MKASVIFNSEPSFGSTRNGYTNGPRTGRNLRILTKSGSRVVIAVSVKCMSTSYFLMRVDVGGGSVPNATRHALARIPLR